MERLKTEDLQECKELTDAIVANLTIINGDGNDLDELDKQCSAIVANLKEIGEDGYFDLDELERQTDSIVRNLQTINEEGRSTGESMLDEKTAAATLVQVMLNNSEALRNKMTEAKVSNSPRAAAEFIEPYYTEMLKMIQKSR